MSLRRGHLVRQQAWDDWLADRPESANVVDLRTPEEIADDNRKWRATWDRTYRSTPSWLKKQEEEYLKRTPRKPLVQFPPAKERVYFPDDGRDLMPPETFPQSPSAWADRDEKAPKRYEEWIKGK